ncbi:peptidylprolyl isomerase [uncultured Eubacterium sp.]|uniref:peptidylprolyl isomerase n=1 Tax=uncultured Eubacterium sp. TaxID=165185 RepID=UPI0015B366AA|nr:peptidylprolyl isomerase [uncultured Eubacterium sp.]
MSKENLTKEEKAQAMADKKYAKLEAKYDKAYDRKDSLNKQIEELKKEILNEPDQKKKTKLRDNRDKLIAERDSIIIREDELVLPMPPKTKKIITAVVSVVIIVALLCAYVATGAVRKGLNGTLGWPQTTFTAYTLKDQDGDKHNIKISTYNYYFSMYYNNLSSTVSQYKKYGADLEQLNMNVDFDKKLSKQTRTEDGKTQTWLEYIQEQVEKQIKSNYMYYYMAVKANDGSEPDIKEDQQKKIDEALEKYETQAKNYGYTLSGYLTAAMGKGVTEEVFRREAKISYIAENYSAEYKEELASKTYDESDIEKYKDENLADLQSVDIKLFECDSEDDAIAFKKELKADGSNFAELASKYSDDDYDKQAYKDEAETSYNNITLSTMKKLSFAISTADDKEKNKYSGLDWLYSADRKAGDIKQESTSVVYVVNPVHLSDVKPVNVRHILIKPNDESDKSTDAKKCTEEQWNAAYDKAKSILDEYNSGDKTSEAFAALAKSNSADSNASSGGLYENVVPNQMVPAFNAWCFDSSRKAGDTAIVKTQYGYHIMYFESASEQTVWQYTAQQILSGEDKTGTEEALLEKTELKKNWFGSRYFEIDTDIDA